MQKQTFCAVCIHILVKMQFRVGAVADNVAAAQNAQTVFIIYMNNFQRGALSPEIAAGSHFMMSYMSIWDMRNVVSLFIVFGVMCDAR